tara:strand:- start:3066 stop:3359 length:294 start_codon:yes stop_codon:yes gene_type:complete
MLSNIVKLFVDTKKEKTILSEKEKVTALLKDLSEKGSKSSIRRITDMFQGYGVEQTKMFLKVRNGHSVEYFGNPFHNLYRIDSRVGTRDFVTHSVGK